MFASRTAPARTAGHRTHPIADHRSLVEGTVGALVLVDVRTPDEVRTGSLPGAINIPVGELPHRLDELPRDARIAVFCRSGARSDQAARFLAANGWSDVVDLAGGILALSR